MKHNHSGKADGSRGLYRIVWRTGREGYEAIARELYDRPDLKSMVDLHIEKFFTPGWKKRLEKRRKAHREANIPDSYFTHTDLKSEIEKKPFGSIHLNGKSGN